MTFVDSVLPLLSSFASYVLPPVYTIRLPCKMLHFMHARLPCLEPIARICYVSVSSLDYCLYARPLALLVNTGIFLRFLPVLAAHIINLPNLDYVLRQGALTPLSFSD